MGNPAYAGLRDQRGTIRANPPSLGAVDAPYALASDILINDTVICTGSSVTLTVQSITISNPVLHGIQMPGVLHWFKQAILSLHLF